MNRFSKTGLTLLFILVLFMPSYIHADPPTLNIPPTNAFDKIHTDNATVSAQNFSMPIIFKGDNGISIHGNNATHTIIINGTNCTGIIVNTFSPTRLLNTIYHNTSGKTLMVGVGIEIETTNSTQFGEVQALIGTDPNPILNGDPVSDYFMTGNSENIAQLVTLNFLVPNNYYYALDDSLSSGATIFKHAWVEYQDPMCGAKTTLTQGTYNQTLANNTPININGNRINFINGTGNPVHVVNSNSGQQVNVTISSAGASGVTQLNGFTGKINLTRTYSNNTEIINDTGNLQISVKPNVVLTNGSKQTFTKSLDLGGPTNNQDIFDDIGIVIRNPLHSKAYTISAGAITQNVTLSLPITNSNTDTFALLNTTQKFNARHFFTPNSTNPMLNVGLSSSSPTNCQTGDLYYNTATGLDLGIGNGACSSNQVQIPAKGLNAVITGTWQFAGKFNTTGTFTSITPMNTTSDLTPSQVTKGQCVLERYTGNGTAKWICNTGGKMGYVSGT